MNAQNQLTTTGGPAGSLALDPRPVLLWRVSCGQISKRPIAVIDHGDGTISVNKKDRRGFRTVQPKTENYESYHETEQAAVNHILAEAQRDLNCAEAEVVRAKRRLKTARSKFLNFCASPNADDEPRRT